MRATLRRIAVVLCAASAFTCEIVLAEPLYRFGVPPWQRGQSVDDIRRLYEPLLDYLGRATNAKITIVTARSYEDMVHHFATGRVDFGTISPVPYVSAQRLNPGVKLLLTELSWDPTRTKRVDSYQGMIVTLRARHDINSVDDLRGKTLANRPDAATRPESPELRIVEQLLDIGRQRLPVACLGHRERAAVRKPLGAHVRRHDGNAARKSIRQIRRDGLVAGGVRVDRIVRVQVKVAPVQVRVGHRVGSECSCRCRTGGQHQAQSSDSFHGRPFR